MSKNKERTKEEREELVHELWYDLTYSHIQALMCMYKLTEHRRQYKSCDIKYRKYMADLINLWLVEWENDQYMVDTLLIDTKDIYKYTSFRITTKWVSLCNSMIRTIKKERDQSMWDRILIWANKQSPIRPFLALVISWLSFIISILK